VAAINKFTDFTADGATPPVDWTVAHTGVTALDCSAFVRARGDRFVPVFGSPTSAYVCFDQNSRPSTTVTTLALPPGVPGA
jgi:hypothetical protein